MIDLSLAKSYIPVCIYCCKVACCSLLYTFLRLSSIDSFHIFVFLSILLYLDRCSRQEHIFNTNTLTAFVVYYLAFDEARTLDAASQQVLQRSAVGLILNILWVCVAVASLLHVERRFSVFQYLPYRPLLITASMLFLHSFVSHGPELEIWTYVRIFDFSVMCIVWLYFVHVRHVFFESAHECTECVIFFGHVLFTSIWVSAASTVIIACVLLYQGSSENVDHVYERSNSEESDIRDAHEFVVDMQSKPGEEHTEKECKQEETNKITVEDGEESIKAMFLLAKAEMQNSKHNQYAQAFPTGLRSRSQLEQV